MKAQVLSIWTDHLRLTFGLHTRTPLCPHKQPQPSQEQQQRISQETRWGSTPVTPSV